MNKKKINYRLDDKGFFLEVYCEDKDLNISIHVGMTIDPDRRFKDPYLGITFYLADYVKDRMFDKYKIAPAFWDQEFYSIIDATRELEKRING